MSKVVHLVISDNLFGGFEHFVSITADTVSLQGLVTEIVDKLRDTLTFHKMVDAKIRLQEKNFHIHDSALDDIINTDNIVYVCHHD